MKYCKKCGMLLEDTTENCIKCGTDVTIPKNISFFPPEIQESMDEQRAQSKNNTKTAVLIICIIVALIGIVIAIAISMNLGVFKITPEDIIGDVARVEEAGAENINGEDGSDVADAGTVGDSDASVSGADNSASGIAENGSDAAGASSDAAGITSEAGISGSDGADAAPAERVIKDDKGRYLQYALEKDDVENEVLNVVYPEDFTGADFFVSYDSYSNRFPFKLTFSASGEDDGVHFLYMSPQQYWHKKSKTKQSFDNNRSAEFYMAYYKYDGAKGFIEDMIKESYPKAKVELKNEEEFAPKVTAAVEDFAKQQNKALVVATKHSDYAHIGEGTTYEVNEEYEFSANVYEYKITTAEKEEIFAKFYMPVIANRINYNNDTYKDKGEIVEWFSLGFAVMEAGNEDIYDDYSPDFNLFIESCVPTDKFMKISQQYSDEVNDYVGAGKSIEPITKKTLTDYGANEECELYEFYAQALNAMKASSKVYFEDENLAFYMPEGIKVGFVAKDAGKIFVSTIADEYPGDKYTEMEAKDVPVSVGVKESALEDGDEDSSDSDGALTDGSKEATGGSDSSDSSDSQDSASNNSKDSSKERKRSRNL